MTVYRSYFLRNASVVIPLAVCQTLAYSWFNHRATPDAHTLPLTAVDRWIPFLPWTVWPYLGLAAAALLLPIFIRQGWVLRQVLIAYALAMGTTFLCFALFPTIYVRPEHGSGTGWTGTVYAWLMEVDSPLCCFPSGHVITPALGCWGWRRDGRRGAAWLAVGLALGSLTILTTKQHYIWDLLGALLVVSGSVTVASRAGPRGANPTQPRTTVSNPKNRDAAKTAKAVS
jgi:hypothetical protein